jgi:hypothetical protein
MLRRPIFFTALICLVVLGLNCSGCNSSNSNQDAGPDGGSDGGLKGDGGTDSGIIVDGTDPGGITLDGGSGGLGDGVTLGPDGGIVLDSRQIDLHFAWIANNSAGTVSKFDTRTGKEVARYYTVIPQDGLGNPVANVDYTQHNSPSRTAIDLYGNVWIANRASALQGTVTKIANDEADCRHSLLDGGVRTSRDLNGDGVIQTNPSAGEFIIPSSATNPNTYDDCVLFSTPLGAPGGADTSEFGCNVKVRALAISRGAIESASAGDIWAGVYDENRFYKLNSTNGQIVTNPDGSQVIVQLTNNFRVDGCGTGGPYGAAVDSQQRMWTVPPGTAKLALIDTQTATLINDNITPPFTAGAYGIAVDGKDRVWLPGYGVGAFAYRYDHGPGLSPTPGTWTQFDFTTARSQIGTLFGQGRGIAVDDQNYAWMSGHYLSGTGSVAQLIGFNVEDGGVWPFPGDAGFIDATDSSSNTSIGVGIDSDNNIWVNNYSGNAMRIFRGDGGVYKTPQQSGTLYTYSDFTGYQLRHFTAPLGRFWRDFQGCGPSTAWLTVTWDATIPPSTAVKLFVRAAATQQALGSAPAYGPFNISPADLRSPPGPVPRTGWLRLEFQLTSTDGRSTPVLNSFHLTYTCQGGVP